MGVVIIIEESDRNRNGGCIFSWVLQRQGRHSPRMAVEKFDGIQHRLAVAATDCEQMTGGRRREG